MYVCVYVEPSIHPYPNQRRPATYTRPVQPVQPAQPAIQLPHRPPRAHGPPLPDRRKRRGHARAFDQRCIHEARTTRWAELGNYVSTYRTVYTHVPCRQLGRVDICMHDMGVWSELACGCGAGSGLIGGRGGGDGLDRGRASRGSRSASLVRGGTDVCFSDGMGI